MLQALRQRSGFGSSLLSPVFLKNQQAASTLYNVRGRTWMYLLESWWVLSHVTRAYACSDLLVGLGCSPAVENDGGRRIPEDKPCTQGDPT